ncbi:E3 ubiquitin-protein ligase SDIR1-like isoform X1 [Asparagus officinalis]|uniref:E3 ubiquitin-protein ligase SDIR1-like isoform X1 n=1 Tax=Asparagus officinalis TaxID=4686 RepID=UPI00098E56E3|nr:E3 ubiquitin-protein ligase SDIR1-like isoform X1 [Asparagus officinalis]XP_020252486.1 E3 ubiquitin-protein ligase SDIR1-like isoform X1 [Asparagus officinalis]XP_020252487.1 E3 ubiquitin-protein ligase SDIR1-like isoform X1 [Asparagus officinalis]XP_020252489.1 E3 ubiquitin-protein ligase SDIR1-like isoform X1 [Asparagus officinalis]
MSAFLCGSEEELERQFSELIPDRRSALCYFAIIVFLLFMILNTEQFRPNMLLVVLVIVCLIAFSLLMWPRWQQHQREADNSPRRHNIEQRVLVPAFATRTQLSDVRIQLALLDRDFDYRARVRSFACVNFFSFQNSSADYDALRALDDDITPRASTASDSTMTDEDIRALNGNRDHHIVMDLHDS